MIKVFVAGGNGQLGQCFNHISRDYAEIDFHFLSAADFNILDYAAVARLVDTNQPHFIVNCAAYTAVDLAEDERDLAHQVNTIGAENLANVCHKYGSTLIHISTDFVFEGNTVSLLTEEDATSPLGVYGLTKLKGEQAIAKHLAQHIIIRTSWLYSEFGNNFVKTMLRLGKERESINVVVDQVGTPTYAVDLARVIAQIIQSEQQNYGVFHYSNEGVTSWYDFAVLIFEYAKLRTKVQPIRTAQYPTKARRPAFSVLDKTKIKKLYAIEIPHWTLSLKYCVDKMN